MPRLACLAEYPRPGPAAGRKAVEGVNLEYLTELRGTLHGGEPLPSVSNMTEAFDDDGISDTDIASGTASDCMDGKDRPLPRKSIY